MDNAADCPVAGLLTTYDASRQCRCAKWDLGGLVARLETGTQASVVRNDASLRVQRAKLGSRHSNDLTTHLIYSVQSRDFNTAICWGKGMSSYRESILTMLILTCKSNLSTD